MKATGKGVCVRGCRSHECPAGEYTTLPVALQPSDVALQGSFTIYLGANRGRGQAYPNGAASNLVSYRWDDTGMVTGRCFRSLLGGLIYPNRTISQAGSVPYITYEACS